MHPREKRGSAMKSLIEHPTTALKWLRSGFSPPDFELLGTDGVFATLTFLDEVHTLARVRTAEGVWTLKHLGLMTPVVTLRDEGGATNLATFHPHALRHGKLQFLDGASFDWEWLHEEGIGGAFLDPGGKPLIRLHAHSRSDLKSLADPEQCDVDLNSALSPGLRNALLAAFGWYLILFDHMKERGAVVAETSLRL
jgi:hypothetical protein